MTVPSQAIGLSFLFWALLLESCLLDFFIFLPNVCGNRCALVPLYCLNCLKVSFPF